MAKSCTILMTSLAFALLCTVGPASAADDDLLAKGKAIATEQCGGCHAVGPDGASPHAQAPPFRTVFESYPPASLAEALAEGIVSGHPDMPQFAFDPPDIEALIAFLDSLNTAK